MNTFIQVPIDWHPKKLEYGTRLWKLNLHYHEFLEEVDDEWFELILIDWIDQNPPYKKGYWAGQLEFFCFINSCCSMDAAIGVSKNIIIKRI